MHLGAAGQRKLQRRRRPLHILRCVDLLAGWVPVGTRRLYGHHSNGVRVEKHIGDLHRWLYVDPCGSDRLLRHRRRMLELHRADDVRGRCLVHVELVR